MKPFTTCFRLLGCLLLSSGVMLPLVAAPPPPTSLPAPLLPPCCRPLPATNALADASIYQLESTWTSDVGRAVKLTVFRGRPQVMALFFTHCEYACPVLVNELKRLEAALPEDLRSQVDFLLVSFDSARDTPAVLAAYREKQQLGTAHWSLLTGAPDDVRELAALLGINYQKDNRGQFAHSNVITVLDVEGRVARQFQGLSLPTGDVIAQLRAVSVPAAAGLPAPKAQ
jgi:protein SCO1/2